MRIVVFGCGYVGLVSGTCFASLGHDVLAIDTNATRVEGLQAGQPPFHEPGLPERMQREIAAGRLCFATSAGPCDIAVLAVGTPAAENSAADLAQLEQAIDTIAGLNPLPRAIITKSTVPAGTAARMRGRLLALRPDWDGVMISNPEFMRQGQAIADFMQPDRVVIGADDARGHEIGRALYANMALAEGQLLTCQLASAELMKYAANTMLATRLALVNELAILAENAGADIGEIAHGIGMDRRIGPQFLRAGPGIGGSCFPKDIRALAHQSLHIGQPMAVVDAVIASNEAHIARLPHRVQAMCGGDLANKRVAVLGVTFKPGTDDLRNSPALSLIPALQQAGAEVVATDPLAGENAHNLLPGTNWAADAYGAAQDADALVVLTEWPEFAALDLPRLAEQMRQPNMADFRNLFDPATARAAGFQYHGLGRGRIAQ